MKHNLFFTFQLVTLFRVSKDHFSGEVFDYSLSVLAQVVHGGFTTSAKMSRFLFFRGKLALIFGSATVRIRKGMNVFFIFYFALRRFFEGQILVIWIVLIFVVCSFQLCVLSIQGHLCR